ncbi:MAG: ATP-binding protein [Thermoanaerobaculia bacterium]|nr:ATP-binding protein [Thermoanaerobaculia bacterium]
MKKPAPQQKNANPDTWEVWLTRLLYYPGDDEEILLSKKVWCSIAVTTFTLSAILLVICLVNGFRPMVLLTALLCTFFLVSMLLFLHLKRYIQAFFLISEVFKVLYSFAAVVVTGGIMQSGGQVFIGMAGIFFALVFPDPVKVWPLLLLYLGTLTLETVLQPYLIPLVQFSPGQNLLFFVLTLAGAILSLFVFMQTFIRERARFRRQETEKLRSLDSARSHFFANISHEFRTPLTVILGMADQIREDPAHHAGDGARLIKRNGRRLLRLVDQLLTLSKLEAGSLPEHFVQADIVLELKYLLESFHSLAESKNIGLHFSSDRPELWMDIDPEKLENIIGNLIDNAIKYTPEGGMVTLRLQQLPPEQEPYPRLLITVEDTGIGIPEQFKEQVFERFFRVGEWPVEGTGVGLAIVREFVHLLDGRIELNSVPGKGTTFSIFLPIHTHAPMQAIAHGTDAAEIQPDKHTPPAFPVSLAARPELLIIEDNPDLVHYLENQLRENYRIRVAHDGEQGIGMAMETVPDIIISDIMMPNKDGFEVCRVLKNDIRTNHIPIILLTARADIASRISGLEAGADAYLAKPFNRQELEVELANLVRLREVLRQKYRQGPPAEKPPGLNERFLLELYQLLEKHYQDEDFGIKAQSTSHVIRSFRLEKAKALLHTTRMTVAEVAYAVGFKDPLYFSRAFSHQFGMAPSDARG